MLQVQNRYFCQPIGGGMEDIMGNNKKVLGLEPEDGLEQRNL